MKQLFTLVLSSALAAPAWAQAGQEPGAWHMHDWGMGWGGGMGWGVGMFLWPLLTIGLLAVLAVALFRWLGAGGTVGPRTQTARDILDARYARGEIDREEYQRRRQDIAGA